MNFQLIERKIGDIAADYEIIFIVNKNLTHEFVKDAAKFEFYDYKGDGVLNLSQVGRIYVGIKDIKAD